MMHSAVGLELELLPNSSEFDFCRLCLSNIYELHQLFPDGSTGSLNNLLLAKIRLLAEVTLAPAEELEAHICSSCVQKLEDFHAFRAQCKASDVQVRKMRVARKRIREEEEQRQKDTATPAAATAAAATKDKRKKKQTNGENDSDAPNSKKSRMETPPVLLAGGSTLGGVFDLVQYCEDGGTPGEYCLLAQGFVYRHENLLRWRCELAEHEKCDARLEIDADFKKFQVTLKHSHVKLDKDGDQRTFEKITPQICTFLAKLQLQQFDLSETPVVGERPADAAADDSDIDILAQELYDDSATDTLPGVPMAQMISARAIQVVQSAEKPTITMNGFTYLQEAVIKHMKPEQIRWRCEEENCQGMIVTTKDYRSYALGKPHKHVPRSVASDSSSTNRSRSASRNDEPLLEVMREVPEEVTAKNKSTTFKGMRTAGGISLVEEFKKAGTDHSFFKASDGSYHMLHDNFFYKRNYAYSSEGGETMWKCTTESCPGTLIAFKYMKKLVGGVPHNHDAVRSGTGEVAPSTSTSTPQVEQETVATGQVDISEIGFYRNSKNVISLLYEGFSYSLQNFLPSGNSFWNCTWNKCGGRIQAGAHFEFLKSEKRHFHNPPSLATPKSWIPPPAAIKELLDKVKLNDEIRRKIQAPPTLCYSELKEKMDKKTPHNRSKTVNLTEET
ncbi:uncharacterized protein LOC128737021 isoform X2 [Sabethes cyaneus]|uniref:uncharacterized protein LOC128737021 isoform X2 n=1 Tax=Sabethes cyaneus TaxID=53552 RepID=UPI00237E9724|nr:uncharacterized protein LOC128737021 isoform X2 [Sabethes cyaneus]